MSERERADAPGAERVEDRERERVRALILARRNTFVAAALAGLGMAAGGGCRGRTCLSAPPPKDGGREDRGSGDVFGADGGRVVVVDAATLDPWKQADARVCLTIE